MQKIFMTIILAMALLASAASLEGSAETPDWTHIHGDSNHTGFTSAEIKPPLKMIWKAAIEPTPHANVVGCWVDGNPVIFTSDDEGCIVALRPKDGKELWSYRPAKGYFLDSPTIAKSSKGRKCIVATASYSVYDVKRTVVAYCLDMEGKELWKLRLDDHFCDSTPTFSEGHVYIATGKLRSYKSDGGKLYKLNPDDGSIIWQADLPKTPVLSSPSKIGESIYIGCSNFELDDVEFGWIKSYRRGAAFYAIDDRSGKIKSSLEMKNMYMDNLTVFDGRELVITGHTVEVSKQSRVDPEDPGKILEYEVETPKNFIAGVDPKDLGIKWIEHPKLDDKNLGLIYAHSPVATDEWVVAGSDEGMIHAINKTDRTRSWSKKLGIGVRLGIAASKNYLYVNDGNTPSARNNSNLRAGFSLIDIRNGDKLWSQELEDLGRGAVTVFDRYVFTFDAKNLYCFTKNDPPNLVVEPKETDLGEITYGDDRDFSLTFKNTGDGEISGKISFEGISLSARQLAFKVSKSALPMQFTVHTSLLEPEKTYTETILIEADNGQRLQASVTFKVIDKSRLSVTPDRIDFGTVPSGESCYAVIRISNSGSGLMKGTLRTNAGWITLDRYSFEGGESLVTITVDTSMLEAGVRHKALIVADAGSQKESVEILINTRPWWESHP